MANKNVVSKPEKKNEDLGNNVSEALSRSEQFIEKNQNTLLIALAAVLVVVAGIVLYNNKVVAPRNQAAAEQLFRGESYFAADSFALALSGDDVDFVGFEQFVNDYKHTKSAKLAKAYIGLCYMNQGEYDKAVKYLKQVKAKDIMVSPALVGAVGDCYVEMGETAKAVGYFEKAAKVHNNLLAPIYLMKAGLAYESLGDYAAALKVYQTLKKEYPLTQEGTEVDKYIERAKLLKK
ncbi:MAG: tetratricopeptide repeat protein [Bacteroidales bacterium]|nr:tetratricopeptide repeat protein [Bacteroidales bacterium]